MTPIRPLLDSGDPMMSLCPICSASFEPLFIEKVLGKYIVNYSHCPSCGFIRAEDPFWIEEAYTDAISSTDTGLLRRNITISSKLSSMLFFLFNECGSGTYVDIAGGDGILTRLMRDNGFNFLWIDKYCPNLMAIGFE